MVQRSLGSARAGFSAGEEGEISNEFYEEKGMRNGIVHECSGCLYGVCEGKINFYLSNCGPLYLLKW